jgi:hypothetical protein
MTNKLIFIFIIFLIFLSCDAEKLFRNAPVILEIKVDPDTVNPFDTVYTKVQARNPEEGALSYHWSVSPNQGVFLDPIDGAATRWIAPTIGGDYTFKVEVSNSYKSSDRSESVKVIEPTKPVVQILVPKHGDYFVQKNEMEIKAEAFHNNGINKIRLFVNELLKTEKSGTSANQYTIYFTPDSTLLGQTEIKIEATANFVLITGADSITINIEGILSRKP